MSVLANGRHDLRITHNHNLSSPVANSKPQNMHWSEPLPLEKLNWLIHLQHIRGEIAACKELIKTEITRSNGKNEYAYFKQGIILRKENRIQEALECFQTCLRLNPLNAEHINEVAKCLYEMRRFRLALEAYLEAERISNYPDWKIYHDVGLCYLRLGDMEKAKEYAHKAVTTSKQESSYALLIKILTSEEDYKSAIAVCNAAVTSCPDSVNMLTESGLLYLKMGHSQHAFERLSSALALDPNCAKALLGIGCITQAHEEHDVALSKYKIAVQCEPESVALWNNIGICFYSKQKYVAAISCLKRALWISPLNWKVLFNLGLVHLSTYQPASAFNFLCAAVNLRPDVAQSFSVLACTLLELNDPHNALRAMKQALLLSPDDGVIVANTTLCSITAGLLDQAKQLLNHFARLDSQTQREESLELMEKLRALLVAVDDGDEEVQLEDNATAAGAENSIVSIAESDTKAVDIMMSHSTTNNDGEEGEIDSETSRNLLPHEV